MSEPALESAWRAAYDAWQAHPTPETELELERAAFRLRAFRRSRWKDEGVTDAELRERFDDDDEPEAE